MMEDDLDDFIEHCESDEPCENQKQCIECGKMGYPVYDPITYMCGKCLRYYI